MEKSENKIVVIECSGKEEQAIRQIEQIDVKGGKDKGIIIVDSEKDPKIAGAIGSSVPGCPSRSKILAEGLAMVALSMAAMSGILPRKLFPTLRSEKICLSVAKLLCEVSECMIFWKDL